MAAKKKAPAKKGAGGRPTSYRAEFCELVMEIVGSRGKSITQFARDIGVSRSTIYEWAGAHKEFSDALTRAAEHSEAFWEDRFQSEFMTSRDVNAPLVKLYFANRFRWSDKGEDEDKERDAQPLDINITVREAQGPVKVTRGTEPDD